MWNPYCTFPSILCRLNIDNLFPELSAVTFNNGDIPFVAKLIIWSTPSVVLVSFKCFYSFNVNFTWKVKVCFSKIKLVCHPRPNYYGSGTLLKNLHVNKTKTMMDCILKARQLLGFLRTKFSSILSIGSHKYFYFKLV